MLVEHHPSEGTLRACADGALAPGAIRVVSIHAEHCKACAESIGFTAVATKVLKVDFAQRGHRRDVRGSETAVADRHWRRALHGGRIGPWLWAGFGTRVAHLEGAAGLGEHLYLIRAKAGATLLRHAHQGPERVVVLCGAFLDDDSRYGVGDFAESDSEISHEPRATSEGTCVCLVATDEPLKFSGLARWIQPLLGV